MHNIMNSLPMPRQVQKLIARPLGRGPVQPIDVLGQPLPLREVFGVAGRVRLVGALEDGEVGLRGDF